MTKPLLGFGHFLTMSWPPKEYENGPHKQNRENIHTRYRQKIQHFCVFLISIFAVFWGLLCFPILLGSKRFPSNFRPFSAKLDQKTAKIDSKLAPQKQGCSFLLTVGSFLLTMELFYLQLCLGAFCLQLELFLLTVSAFLLTIEAFLLRVGKCV